MKEDVLSVAREFLKSSSTNLVCSDLVCSDALPKVHLNEDYWRVMESGSLTGVCANISSTLEKYAQMGIEVIDSYNGVLWRVLLPPGWRISNILGRRSVYYLFDDIGKARAYFHYNGRVAFINFTEQD